MSDLDDKLRSIEMKPRADRELNSPSMGAGTASAADSRVKSVFTRYTDAYRVADGIVLAGTLIKVAAVVVGVAGVVMSAPGGGGGDWNVVILITSLAFALFGFGFGTMVNAQGQHLRAALDCAVHSSPFLSNDDRARVMGL